MLQQLILVVSVSSLEFIEEAMEIVMIWGGREGRSSRLFLLLRRLRR